MHIHTSPSHPVLSLFARISQTSIPHNACATDEPRPQYHPRSPQHVALCGTRLIQGHSRIRTRAICRSRAETLRARGRVAGRVCGSVQAHIRFPVQQPTLRAEFGAGGSSG